MVAEGAVVPVVGAVVPGVGVPGVVVPEVVVPDVVVPAVGAAVAPPVWAQAAPPASAVTTKANVAFLRSYLIARLLNGRRLSNAATGAMFLRIYRVAPRTGPRNRELV